MGSGKIAHTYFLILEKLRQKHAITTLLKIAKLPKSTYYLWRSSSLNSPIDKDETLAKDIHSIHKRYPFYGYRRITAHLLREGKKINHKRVYRIMKREGLRSTIRKKRKRFGKKGSSVFPNVLNREFASNSKQQKLVTDITYLPTRTGCLFLSAIQDLYNNEIIAYKIGKRNTLPLVLDTLEELTQTNSSSTILHFDQGHQYTSKHYKTKLEKLGFTGSHSRKGNCLENACIESFFSHLKTEAIYAKALMTESERVDCVTEYITFYNSQRFQKKLGNLTPIEFREKVA